MLKTIILVSERAEHQAVLGNELRRYNAALTIQAVMDRKAFGRFSRDDLLWARLIGFCTDILVPANILQGLGFGAYNFHPGSPDYPGWGAPSFAIYDGVTRFGATAHVMEAKVDTGAIVGTCLFDVQPFTDQIDLETKTFYAAIQLFAFLAGSLVNRLDPLPPIEATWGARRCTREAYARMCQIEPDMRVDELLRHLDAFGAGPTGLRPKTTYRGATYQLALQVVGNQTVARTALAT